MQVSESQNGKVIFHLVKFSFRNYTHNIKTGTGSLYTFKIQTSSISYSITGSPSRSSNDLLCKQHMLLNLKNINVFLVGTLCTMSIMAWSLLYLRDFFVNNYGIHEHNTRIANYLHVPPVLSDLSKSSIQYQCVMIWDKISKADMNSDASELIFKIMFKRGIQQEVITM